MTTLILIALIAYGIYRVVLYIKKVRYFKSSEFLQHKQEISSAVNEYNEISNYVNSFEQISLQANNVDRYKYASLANYENTSIYKMNRNKHKKDLAAKNVYQTSLAVVRRASEEPLKYLCKYFDFKPNEENLLHIQEIGEKVSRFINAQNNLEERLIKIETDFAPPKYILKYYKTELLKRLEVEIPTINFDFPIYRFEYVSAGGNSQQSTSITLDDLTIEALIEYMGERVKYKKSAKAQRSLMTKKLREYIKKRDNYTCQICGASVAEQSLLLLEVDHITPVSKGGLSTEDNLQTLCWKCNRSKSDKIA
ncbi:HNH endonuclease [Streptococcus sp. H49]|uniref:HNH endonuclease n=1 Tax=Streptococcus huangxiaojuni TaxID=3237239 RepID=UPI0034A5B821